MHKELTHGLILQNGEILSIELMLLKLGNFTPMTFKLYNQNFILSCTTSFDLTNKQAIGQKVFKRYVKLHVISKHLSSSAQW